MSRQDANAAFALTSFLYGGNAAYIEDLYARYEADPKAVDAEWQSFFQSLKDDARDVEKNARGPSWSRPGWPVPERSDLISALDGDARRQGQGAGADPRRRHLFRRGGARDPRLDPRPDAHSRLPRARPQPHPDPAAIGRKCRIAGAVSQGRERSQRRRPRSFCRCHHSMQMPRHPRPHVAPESPESQDQYDPKN